MPVEDIHPEREIGFLESFLQPAQGVELKRSVPGDSQVEIGI